MAGSVPQDRLGLGGVFRAAVTGDLAVTECPLVDDHHEAVANSETVLRRSAFPQNTQRGAIHSRREVVKDLSKSVIVPGRQARRQRTVRRLRLR